MTFPSRIGEPAGKTSPEELMAASHAACYAMALNATLGRKAASAARTVVSATVSADKSESGIKLTSSKLKVVAEGLQGIDPSQFAEVAKAAEAAMPDLERAARDDADRCRRAGEIGWESGSGARGPAAAPMWARRPGSGEAGVVAAVPPFALASCVFLSLSATLILFQSGSALTVPQ